MIYASPPSNQRCHSRWHEGKRSWRCVLHQTHVHALPRHHRHLSISGGRSW